MDQAPFWLEDWYVEPSTGRIKRQESIIKLEPKVMRVLVCLARDTGQVISRASLESEVWANMVVGYDALASTIIKLRKALGDDPKNPHFIETVPKKGYRLIVATSQNQSPAQSIDAADRPEKKPARSLKKLVFINAIVLITMLFIIYTQFTPQAINNINDTANGLPSIAVLPFKNLSGDPAQEYFSDGITSDLIVDLSKVSGVLVIARNSVFAYKNTELDIRQVGKELGVRYIIEGSVRKIKNKVRISAQLVNTENGYSIWADRLDGTLDNLFEFQDRFIEKIVSALEIKLTDTESKQLTKKYTNNIEAYDLFLRGYQKFWEFSKNGNNAAKDYFKRAIAQDKNFARAYGNLALTHSYDVLNGWSSDIKVSKERARYYAKKGIELDDKLPNIHWAMGLTAIISRDYKLALDESQKVIALSSNNADGYGLLATTLNYAANPKDALKYMQKAMRLNPRHPFAYKVILGEIYFNLHKYPEAINNFEAALERNPEAQESRLWLAAAYAHSGRPGDAEWEIEQIRVINPKLTLSKIEEVIPLNDPGQLKHLTDGLHKAGLTF